MYTNAARVGESGEQLPTGIDSIDRRLGGGFQAGSLISLISPPTTQSHAILQELMRQRPTIYVTTLRPESSIKTDLSRVLDRDLQVSVQEVGEAASGQSNSLQLLTDSEIHSLKTTERDRVLDEIHEIVRSIDNSVNVIVDPANPLERGANRSDYQTFLRKFCSKLLDTKSLGLFHCSHLERPPAFRESTLSFADVVWEIEVVSGMGNKLQIQSRIPKNRGGDAILENLNLVVSGTRVYTDDSRNI